MNKIMLIGNLGKDPEMTYNPAGLATTKFSLAVNRVTKSKSGERQEETEWFNIVMWDNLAVTASSFLKKGQKVYLEGRLSQRKYTDKNGVERTATEVIARDMEFLTPKGQQSGGSSSNTGGGDDLGELDDHPF
jgi:single-strand DNA-binding protein